MSQRGTKIQKAAQILPYRLQLALSISLLLQTTAATDTDLIHHRKYTEAAELQFYMLWRKTMRRRSDSSQEIHWSSWASILHVMKKNNETQIWFITGNTLKQLSFNSTCYEEKQWVVFAHEKLVSIMPRCSSFSYSHENNNLNICSKCM